MSGRTARKARAPDNGAQVGEAVAEERVEVEGDTLTEPAIERTKAPPRVIFCDELVIKDGEDEYHPHAGELIRLIGGASVGDVKMAVDLQKFGDIDMSTEEGRARVDEVKAGLELVTGQLALRLHSWTWTDDTSTPYPQPTKEILESLRFEELMWILTASLKVARSDNARLKDSAPSTTS